MTNREIAQTLFVTARTVEGHLTQVFRKLDLSARDELAGALAAPGDKSGGSPRCEPGEAGGTLPPMRHHPRKGTR